MGCRGDLGIRGDLQARYAAIDKAVYDKDIGAYSGYLSKDFKLTDKNGKSFNKTDVLESVKRQFQVDSTQSYTVLDDMKPAGDHVEVTVTWNSKTKQKQADGHIDDIQIRDLLKDVWIREDGQWKVGTSTVLSHDTWVNGKYDGGVPTRPL